MKEFAAVEWQRALRTLASGTQLIKTDPDSAASRAYYAAFHALTAMFALRGQTFLKHSALRGALHRELIKAGLWGVELGRAYDFLMDMRETGDYGGLVRVKPIDAEMALDKAKTIIEAVKQNCPGFE
ncbi:MAG: HEPN domain-containing protein [Sedimentisphaerales bacterium]|nr:HEPN domain-containing protein [Sedimentisphaerales bacterium]